jgi:predicted nicotinamide N-methyase
MARWLLKAVMQRGVGALPHPHLWNRLLQDWLTGSTQLTDEIFAKNLNNSKIHLANLRRHGPTVLDSFSVFELGTGWFPVVSIALSLCGARQIWTWDIAPLLTLDRLRGVIDRFLTLEEEGALKNDLSALPDRLALLREVRTRCNSGEKCQLAELLKRLNIHYQIRNAAQSGLPPQSVDLIVSDVVLEYISLERLSEIFHEFRSPDFAVQFFAFLRSAVELAE